jgi:predicted NUDIX family NTP pyrophosphohydrolase
LPARRQTVSAGLLLFRRTGAAPELLLAHPGGPFWARRDDGAWTIPKGVPAPGEALLDAAVREFTEETGASPVGPYRSLGSVTQKAGKTVHAWAAEGDLDPSTVVSNTTTTEWPPRSGRWITYPEVDRCAWFDPVAARRKLNPAQAEFVDRLLATLETGQ